MDRIGGRCREQLEKGRPSALGVVGAHFLIALDRTIHRTAHCGRHVTFHMAEAAVPRLLFERIVGSPASYCRRIKEGCASQREEAPIELMSIRGVFGSSDTRGRESRKQK